MDAHRLRSLRRETAVELPVTPSKSLNSNEVDTFLDTRVINKHLSADQSSNRPISSGNYLIPSMSEPAPRPYKNSAECLRKNSSTDTEYSLQPYKVIKQSSNETNTSFTGSFNNIDQPVCDLSVDTENSPNVTVIDNNAITVTQVDEKVSSKTTTFGNVVEMRQTSVDFGNNSGNTRSNPPFLMKQYSIDQGTYRAIPEAALDKNNKMQKSCLKPPIGATGGGSPKFINKLQDSSSLSADESKDDRTIPTISTNVVQDEIAKLSSNIKSSTEEEKDPSFNETMC